MSNILIAAGGDEGYQISRSVRLRSSASAYFNRTPAGAGDRKTWSYRIILKRGALTTQGALISARTDDNNRDVLQFQSDATLQLVNVVGGSATTNLVTTQVFRDPSAFYDLLLAVDTTQATASNRVKLYVNGVQVTSFSTSTYPALNDNFTINAAVAHGIGRYEYSTPGGYYDGLMTESILVVGQQLTPSSFGETNPVTGVWQPKKYAGTYGTNGFYLNFSDPSAATAAAIGKDYSGNGNNWTPNNISVTAGVTYDSMLDVPTMWADGGNGRGNYAVLNPIAAIPSNASSTVSDANLKFTTNVSEGTGDASAVGTIALPTTGKWYWEIIPTTVATAAAIRTSVGVQSMDSLTASMYNKAQSFVYAANGQKVNNNTTASYGNTYTTNDVIGIAVDLDNGAIYFAKNNTWQNAGDPTSGATKTGAAYTTLSGSNNYTPAVGYFGVFNCNFGQRPFAYTPPTGFKALNTQNLTDGNILKGSNQFSTLLDTGANIKTASNAAYIYQMQWIKDRANVNNHQLADTVRGLTAILQSNTTAAETTYSAPTGNSVAWVWNAGSVASSNTAGSITSQVAANVSAGFSVVTYTGTGANATVGHGLGVAPKMIFVKKRGATTGNWIVGHAAWNNWTRYLALNLTNALLGPSATIWNSTAPTSTVFSLGTDTDLNGSGSTYVAYCFAEVAGYSKFGSWTNNNSTDGTFVYLGFRPRFILLKNSDNVEGWFIWDSARQTYNLAPPSSNWLNPNLSNAEGANNASTAEIDGLSNGFKIRTTNPAAGEVSFGTRNYIYAAFAENPFKNSLAR